ncbi:MAG: gliding motility-associated C-terminal domain-containing protein [Saprospiraceae bacterium]|nr:gliding motility-associated C-terminal domain-containing protein [Saprospiraceae bacterium]
MFSKNIIILVLAFTFYLFSFNNGRCQVTSIPTIYLTSDTVAVGDEVCLGFGLRNSERIQQISFSLIWDPNILRFSSTEGYLEGYDLNSSDFGTSLIEEGTLTFAKSFDPFVVTTQDTILFSICFLVEDGQASSTIVEFSHIPTEIIVADDRFIPVGFNRENGTISIESNQSSLLIVNSIETQGPVCFGGSDGSVVVEVKGGINPLDFKWSDGSTSLVRNDLSAGIYSLTIEDVAGNRIDTTLVIQGPEPIVVSASIMDVNRNQNGSIQLHIIGGLPPYIINWDDGATTEFLENLETGTYFVTVTDDMGCTVDTSYHVEMEGIIGVNFLTPNGDGRNDSLIFGLNNRSASLSIFNRWGNVVYQNTNYQEDWTGLDQNSNQLPDGVYYYVLQLGDEMIKSSITLIR